MSLPLSFDFLAGRKRPLAGFFLAISLLSQILQPTAVEAQMQVIKLDGSSKADAPWEKVPTRTEIRTEEISFPSQSLGSGVRRQGETFSADNLTSAAVEPFFNAQIEDYFATCFANSPSWGTQSGFHQYDNQLEDLSASSLSKFERQLLEFRQKFSNPSFSKLPRAKRLDLSMIQANIAANLLDLQKLHFAQRDPDRYPSLIADSISPL